MGTTPSLYERVQQSKSSLKGHFARTALILGTGLGSLENRIEKKKILSCKSIPGFPESYRENAIYFGQMAGEPVVAIESLPTLHDGARVQDIGYPAWLFAALGAQQVLITAAGGSLNPKIKAGNLLVVEDHLNLTGQNPLLGLQDERLGPAFPAMSQVYDREWTSLALKLARKRKISARTGTIAQTLGPTLETPAECRFYQRAGADGLVQSLVLEAIASLHAGMDVLAMVAITDEASTPSKTRKPIESFLMAAEKAAPQLENLVLDLMRNAAHEK